MTVQVRPGKTCFRFWQEGTNYDRNYCMAEAIFNVIDYIHLNPVRKGLCDKAIDWKWSSARCSALNQPGWHGPDLPKIQGLPAD